MIYADNAATTRMSEAAVQAMTECIREDYGNPSSLYAFGQRAKEKLTNQAVAEALDGLPAYKMHCSVLAEEAIQSALEDYRKRREAAAE